MEYLREKTPRLSVQHTLLALVYHGNYTDRAHENQIANILKQLDKSILFLYVPYMMSTPDDPADAL
jgi:hypothetical protein